MRFLWILVFSLGVSLPGTPHIGLAETPAPRIVAIGDLHGDFEALWQILQTAKLVDDEGRWIGAKTQLVLMGDLNDRGSDTRLIYDLLVRLETEGQKAGGGGHALLGSHEIFLLSDDFRYVGPGEAELFAGSSKPLTQQAREEVLRQVHSSKSKYADWFRRRKAVVKIGDTVFTHAGIEEWALSYSIDRINAETARWVNMALERNALPEAQRPRLPSSWVTSLEGPFWTRELANRSLDEDILDGALGKWGAKTLVIGHSNVPQVSQSYDNKVVLTDTNISSVMGGTPTYAENLGGGWGGHILSRSPGHSLMRTRSIRTILKGSREACLGPSLAKELATSVAAP